VAHLVHADLLVLLSDVDGLYDGPPSKAGSRLITDVHGEEQLADVRIGGPGSHIGSGGMHTKLEAARIATGAGIPTVLTSAPNAAGALAGADIGTLFHPTGRRRPTRLLWLAHASVGKGSLVLDEGAVRALRGRRASLLPAGITRVTGTFTAGDPVDLVDEQGATIARGLVNYDAAELPGLLGRSTRDLARELGPEYEREVVHRDDLVLL
jgi:glutamate 5-kinase